MFRKQKHLIGLDLGTQAVKMIQMQETKAGPKLLNLGIAVIPREVFDDDKIADPLALSGAIQRLTRHLKVKDKIVALSVSGFEVMIKQVEMQTMPEEELETRMKSDLGQIIPFNLDEVNVSHQILGPDPENPNRTDVLLVAAKKQAVDQYVALLDGVGFESAVVDVHFFALSNAFEATYGKAEQERVALLNIGASTASLNVFHRGVPGFTRDISIGGYQITDRLEGRYGLSPEEAERAKLGEEKGGIPRDGVREIFHEVTATWLEEIHRVLQFYYNNYTGHRIDRMCVCGGSSRIPGLDRVLSKRFEMDVEIFNPLVNMEFDKKHIDPKYLEYVGPQMAIAMGLGLRRLDEP